MQFQGKKIRNDKTFINVSERTDLFSRSSSKGSVTRFVFPEQNRLISYYGLRLMIIYKAKSLRDLLRTTSNMPTDSRSSVDQSQVSLSCQS